MNRPLYTGETFEAWREDIDRRAPKEKTHMNWGPIILACLISAPFWLGAAYFVWWLHGR